MLDRGVYVIGFSYPVVPQGKARIRTQISAAHTREDLAFALEQFAAVKREFGVLTRAAVPLIFHEHAQCHSRSGRRHPPDAAATPRRLPGSRPSSPGWGRPPQPSSAIRAARISITPKSSPFLRFSP